MKLLIVSLLLVCVYGQTSREYKEELVMQKIEPRKISCLTSDVGGLQKGVHQGSQENVEGMRGVKPINVHESLFSRLGHSIRDFYSHTGGKTIYDTTIKSVKTGRTVDWSNYKGKVVLLVNVASFSKYTPQLTKLNDLMSTKRDDLQILAVPCNQFGLKEPAETGEEIMNVLKHVRPGRGFTPNFELTEKVKVNGQQEHQLFTTLKNTCPSPITQFAPKYLLGYDNMDSTDIRWNFEKFLIDRDGRPLVRYSSEVMPEDIQSDINRLITNPEQFKKELQSWDLWGVTTGQGHSQGLGMGMDKPKSRDIFTGRRDVEGEDIMNIGN
jgi:glutathione peroxidase